MDKELIAINPQNALSVFTGEEKELDAILAGIEKQARSLIPDVTTAKGRDAIKSNAMNVARAKVLIEAAGKELADKQKEIPKLIDASRKRSREFLDALRDDVRLPLTEWENEQERIKAEAAELARLEAERVENERLFSLLWDEAHVMNDRFDIDKEKAELASQKQAEQNEKDRLVREAELIEQGRLAAEQANKEALEKAEREKLEAEQRAKQAAEYARLAKEAAELAEKQRVIDAEKVRVAAEEKAERQRLQAIEDERKRVAAEAAKQKAIDDLRAADREHRANVMRDAKEKLMSYCCIDEDTAKMIVRAACDGKLGALKIEF